MRLLATLKTYGLAIAAACAGVLALVAKILLSQNSRLREKAKRQSENLDHAKRVLDADINISEQEDTRLKEAVDEIKKGNAPRELTDPNDWVWSDED